MNKLTVAYIAMGAQQFLQELPTDELDLDYFNGQCGFIATVIAPAEHLRYVTSTLPDYGMFYYDVAEEFGKQYAAQLHACFSNTGYLKVMSRILAAATGSPELVAAAVNARFPPLLDTIVDIKPIPKSHVQLHKKCAKEISGFPNLHPAYEKLLSDYARQTSDWGRWSVNREMDSLILRAQSMREQIGADKRG
jgi:hypothetical protein